MTLPPWVVLSGKMLLALITLAAILVRHYVATLTAMMAGAALWEYGPWGLALAVVVPSAYATAVVSHTMRLSGMTSIALTLKHMVKARKIQKNWEDAATQLRLVGKGSMAPIAKLVNVLPSDRGVTADVITGNIGMDASDLVKHERKFAAMFFCDRVTIRSESPWMASVSWEWGHHLRRTIRSWDVPVIGQPKNKPALAAFGIQENGDAAKIVSNLSVLIGGLSGGGKSSTIWAMIGALQKVAPIRLRVVDPSGVEFAEAKRRLGQGLVHDYISDPNRPGSRSMEEFWGDLGQDFDQRMDRVEKSGARWHKPTEQEPLDVLVIDEILPLAAQLKKDPTSHIVGRILFLGRKAGFMCIAASQLGQKETIGPIRDLFPQRVCHRTETRYVTDAFLGDGAELDGARCSKLDAGRDQGVFYMAEDGVSGYTACRSAWISDEDVERIAAGEQPIRKETVALHDKPTSVYAFYDEFGGLLYVGIAESSRLADRWAEHSRSKPWWPEVVTKVEVDSYPDRYLAETAEAMMIKKHHPKYNIQHNGSMKWAKR